MRISDWSSDVCSSDLRCSLSWILPPDRLPVRRQCCTHFIEDGVGQRRGAARRGDSGGIPLVALQVGARADDLLAVVEAHHVLLQSAAVAVAGDGGERLLHCLDRRALGVAGNDDQADRKSVGVGKGGYVRVDLGGGRRIKKKKK